MFITLIYKTIVGTIVQSNLLSFQIQRFPLFDTINKRLSIISRIPLRTLMIETAQLQRWIIFQITGLPFMAQGRIFFYRATALFIKFTKVLITE